ncbi:MAG: polysaccharide pyruvyl transferase family protein [Phycisphaerales bacterium]|nr:polysaccharide pyruvyl transferase family protein [Phycisphaerales bacterium]
MRELVKLLLLDADCRATRFARTIRQSSESAGRILVLPPALTPGSVGDEAMLTAAIAALREAGVISVTALSQTDDDAWGAVCGFNGADVSLGSAPCRDFAATRRFARLAAAYSHFVTIGADMLDGCYGDYRSVQLIRAVEVASRVGVTAGFTAFSFNRMPSPAVISAMRRLPASVPLLARDPVSKERLEQQLDRRVEASADVAFLLRPELSCEESQSLSNWLQGHRAAGCTTFGVNLNVVPFAEAGVDPAAIPGMLANVLEAVDRKCGPLALLLVPHDRRDADRHASDAGLAKGLLDALPPQLRARTRMASTELRAAAIKALAAGLDAVLTGRMHFAIASLGMGVPVLCAPYQDKFEGLLALFDLPAALLGASDLRAEGAARKPSHRPYRDESRRRDEGPRPAAASDGARENRAAAAY